MAEVGNLTYNITVNDEVLKELAALRAEVSQIRGSQLIHEAWIDCQESKLGKKVENEEIKELKQAVSSLKLQITLLEHDKLNSPTIEAYGEVIAKQVEDKYKKMLEEEKAQTNVDVVTCRCPNACKHRIPVTYLITSQGEVVDTKGHSPVDSSGPFKVQGKSVYISNQFIN